MTEMDAIRRARRVNRQVDQVVEVVVDHGYRPQSIVAVAGTPLRLVFHRWDDDPCMDRIIFSSPHLDRRLARGTATTIVLPPQPAGEIRFTCGMGRYHGQIVLRSRVSRLEASRIALLDAAQRAWQSIRGPVPPARDHPAPAVAQPPTWQASTRERLR